VAADVLTVPPRELLTPPLVDDPTPAARPVQGRLPRHRNWPRNLANSVTVE